MKKLILHFLIAVLGLWLAQRLIPGVVFEGSWEIFLLCAFILGVINLFAKPILKLITLPLRIITFGLFGLVVNGLILWFVDILFPELTINGLKPLFIATLIFAGLNFLLYRQLK